MSQRILLGLLQGETLRVPGQQTLAARPLLNGLVENSVVAKADDVKLAPGAQARQDFKHGLAVCFLIHGTDTHSDLWKVIILGFFRSLPEETSKEAAHGVDRYFACNV